MSIFCEIIFAKLIIRHPGKRPFPEEEGFLFPVLQYGFPDISPDHYVPFMTVPLLLHCHYYTIKMPVNPVNMVLPETLKN